MGDVCCSLYAIPINILEKHVLCRIGGSHSGGYVESCLLGYNAVASQPTLCLPPAFTLVSCLAYSSTLKMEAKCSSETSVDFQRTTRHYIPEDRTLQICVKLQLNDCFIAVCKL
jgi:hypothetical protein